MIRLLSALCLFLLVVAADEQSVETECGGETCSVGDLPQRARRLQSQHRVVTMPTPPRFHDVVESVVNYLVVHEAYYAWSKDWFPKPLADAWFEFAGNRMFERFESYVDEIAKFFEEFFQETINGCYTQKHCSIDLTSKKEVHMDHEFGLKLKAELQDLKGVCDFEYDYFGKADLQIGRTAFTQFTIDFATPYTEMVTVFHVPVKFWDVVFRGRPLHIAGEVKGNLHMDAAPTGFTVTLNGPKLKPWGPDHQSVVNSCVEAARYDHLQMRVDYCFAEVFVELYKGGKFTCPNKGYDCPLDPDPSVCQRFCQYLNNALCYQIEDAVSAETKYLSNFLTFSTNSLLPYCETGTRTDPVA